MYYKVEIEPYVFYVKQVYDEDRTILQIGSSAFPDCVSIHVFNDTSHAIFEGLLYDELCATNQPLKKEDQGTQKMVQAILHVAKIAFPFILEYQLMDTSSIICDPIKKMVRLADMYFFVYGMTWYEAKFGAKPLFMNYDRVKSRFLQKPSLPFDRIWKYMPKEMQHDKPRIQQMYSSSPTWHAFFHAWYMTDSCLPFYYLCSHESTIMKDISTFRETLYGTDWMIEISQEQTDKVRVSKTSIQEMPKIEWYKPKARRTDFRLFGGKQMLIGM